MSLLKQAMHKLRHIKYVAPTSKQKIVTNQFVFVTREAQGTHGFNNLLHITHSKIHYNCFREQYAISHRVSENISVAWDWWAEGVQIHKLLPTTKASYKYPRAHILMGFSLPC